MFMQEALGVLNGFFASDSLREKLTLIGQLCSVEIAVITEEVSNFLFLGVFPNWMMVHGLLAATVWSVTFAKTFGWTFPEENHEQHVDVYRRVLQI